jgi:uncharacterized protein YkwD
MKTALVICFTALVSGCASTPTVNPLQSQLDAAIKDNTRLAQQVEQDHSAMDRCARAEAKVEAFGSAIAEEFHNLATAVETKATSPETASQVQSSLDAVRVKLGEEEQAAKDALTKFRKEHNF